MSGLTLRGLTLMLLIAFLVWSSNFERCIARSRQWRGNRVASASFQKKKGKNHSNHNNSSTPKAKALSHNKVKPPPLPPHNPKPKPDTPASPPQKGQHGGHSVTFNVLHFGAKGDGSTDDTKSFQAAWNAACKVMASTLIVPVGSRFLVGPISFSGPYCAANIVFQLDGTIIAPTDSKAWGKGLFQWLEFTKLKGITIQGKGIIDGRGSVWWQQVSPFDDPIDDDVKLIVPLNTTVQQNPPIRGKLNGKMPMMKPTALRFYGSVSVTVTGITIQNSPQFHLKFDNCNGVLVHDMSVSSPGDSPNTDGIHF